MNLNATVTEGTQVEIQNSLSCSPEQAKRIVEQLESLEGLRRYFNTYPEDSTLDRNKELLERAERALDYKRAYRIAIVAKAGVGKSTFANAILGREDFLPARKGTPATGTVVEIYQTEDSPENEYLEIFYRDKRDIRDLIQKRLIDRFELNTDLAERIAQGNLDASLVDAIQAVTSTDENFSVVRQNIVDVINQYINRNANTANPPVKLKEEHNLKENPNLLWELIDESSERNQNDDRQIGLIKKISCHLCPPEQSEQDESLSLKLPSNVCLIDLPGIDGTPLHRSIISKDIEEADAVVFMFGIDRQGLEDEQKMMASVGKNIGISDPAKIFPVLNKIDRVFRGGEDHTQVINSMKEMVEQLVEELQPEGETVKPIVRIGDLTFFPVSAHVACLARKKIKGIELDEEDSHTYDGYRRQIDAKDASDVLNNTQIPAIVEAVNKLATNSVETLIREATDSLNQIKGDLNKMLNQDSLSNQELEMRKQEIIPALVEAKLKERRKDMLWCVRRFRRTRLDNRDKLKGALEARFQKVCDSINNDLVKACPSLWMEALTEKRDDIREIHGRKIDPGAFITLVNIELCHLLSEKLEDLALEIAEDYRCAFDEQKIQEKLLKLGKDIPNTEETFSRKNIKDVIDELEASLKQVCKRVAAPILLDPEHILYKGDEPLVNPEESSTEENGAKAVFTVMRSVDDIWKQTIEASRPKQESSPHDSIEYSFVPESENPVPSHSNFEEFIKSVRASYFDIIQDQVIVYLLNVYSYETLIAREVFVKNIKTLIRNALIILSTSDSPPNILSFDTPKLQEIHREIADAGKREGKRKYLEELSNQSATHRTEAV